LVGSREGVGGICLVPARDGELLPFNALGRDSVVLGSRVVVNEGDGFPLVRAKDRPRVCLQRKGLIRSVVVGAWLVFGAGGDPESLGRADLHILRLLQGEVELVLVIRAWPWHIS